MLRSLLVLACCAALGLGWSLKCAHDRLERLENAPRADPGELHALRAELDGAERRIGGALAEITALRGTPQKTQALDRRLALLEGELQEATCQLVAQRDRLEEWEGLRDEVGPQALDRRMEVLQANLHETLARLDELARHAVDLAQSTRTSLDAVEHEIARDASRLWEDLLGPTVQLLGDETVGSGVLLPSRRAGDDGGYSTCGLTAWHVVRDIQRGPEHLDAPIPVTVYRVDGTTSPERGRLLRHDPDLDVALLELETRRPFPHGARLASRRSLEDARVFQQIYAVGCPLGNDPIPTFGEIADTDHLVDGGRYWMISAPTYVGNSGGGIFDAHTHELLGIFCKIYTHGSLRPTVVPHMGLATSLLDVYDWLESVGYASLEPGEPSVAAQAASAER